jgi:RNA polymerase sigma-70 factor (ECF subfamily)
MTDPDWLAKQFEHHRDHLRNVAYRMLGTTGEAEDAVQEAWVRLSRADAAAVENLGGWLTTVTARVCLDVLRSRKVRQAASEVPAPADEHRDPARDMLLADSIGSALLVVLETLAPAERVAFVLHDMFDLPFDEIARVLDRSEAATRQLASRARRRIQRRDAADANAGHAAREVVDAFLAASRAGDFDALLAVLDPAVVLRADDVAVRVAAANRKWSSDAPELAREARGAQAVATTFKGRAGGASRATIDGEPGAVWVAKGHVRSAVVFTIANGRVAAIDLVMEPAALAELDVELLDA